MNKIVVFEGFLLCEEVDVENLKKSENVRKFFSTGIIVKKKVCFLIIRKKRLWAHKKVKK
jgi:hypothetical protein